MTKPKAAPPLELLDEMRAAFLEQAAELWDAKREKFTEVVAGAEEAERKIHLAFAADINLSGPAAELETSIRFSQIFSDSRKETWPVDAEVAEPGQLVDEVIIRESIPKVRPRRKKRA